MKSLVYIDACMRKRVGTMSRKRTPKIDKF